MQALPTQQKTSDANAAAQARYRNNFLREVEAFARDPELVAGWPLVKFDRPMMSRHTAP